MRQEKRALGIMNHWMVNNYGAVLLAYALEKKLLELGYQVETISYLPDEVAKPWKISMISKIGLVQYILRLGYFAGFVLPRQKAFSKFRGQINTSLKTYTDKSIYQAANEYDKVLIGGDQLWNCKINYYNENNFLPFIQENRRKIVYAASLAQENMREGFENEFRKLAEGFGYVTTREQRASEIIEELTSLKAPRVCDPAFLLKPEEWEKLAEPVPQLQGKKYIFVYQVQSDVSVTVLAQRIAKEKGIKVVYCPFPLRKQIKCTWQPYASPERWLWLVKNAEYVLTDAFHGLVFAIIFNKQFLVEISTYGADTKSRITNLLELLGLKNRLMSEKELINIDEIIDWESINSFIEEDREQSIQHIHNMMNL